MTSTIYNQAFHDMIRGKKRIDPIALKEGYDEGSDSYMIPVAFNKDYTTALAKIRYSRKSTNQRWIYPDSGIYC